jgi:hypothetical protein
LYLGGAGAVDDTASLYAAIAAAKAETPGTPTITFDDDITLPAAVTPIDLQPGVTLVIEGDGDILDGDGSYRGLTIDGGEVEIRHLPITGGQAADGIGTYHAGTLSFTRSTLWDDRATSLGGAFYKAGSLTVNNCTLSGNGASDGGE